MDPREILREARDAGRLVLDEFLGKKLFAHYGISVPKGELIQDALQLRRAVKALNPPFALKLVSPDATHKSDVGGVKLGLQDAGQAAEAMDAIAAAADRLTLKVTGYLVEEMAPPGREMMVGGISDPRFGPVVVVGLGGIFVEVFSDVAFRICPITGLDAQEMVTGLRTSRILRGIRGQEPVSEKALVESLLQIGGEGGLFLDLADEVSEIDVNPLIVSSHGAVAADVRLVLHSRKGHDESNAKQ